MDKMTFIIMIGDFDIFLLLIEDQVAKNKTKQKKKWRLQITLELGMIGPSFKKQKVTKLLKNKKTFI